MVTSRGILYAAFRRCRIIAEIISKLSNMHRLSTDARSHRNLPHSRALCQHRLIPWLSCVRVQLNLERAVRKSGGRLCWLNAFMPFGTLVHGSDVLVHNCMVAFIFGSREKVEETINFDGKLSHWSVMLMFLQRGKPRKDTEGHWKNLFLAPQKIEGTNIPERIDDGQV